MGWYKSGSVNVTNGNATVYGNGTLWVDVSILYSGDVWVGPDGRLYEIASIQSNTQLTLALAYLGATANTQSYAIMPIGLLPSALAQQVKTTLSTANTALSQTVRFDANQNLTSGQKATARSNIGATAAADVGLGLLSKSVAGGVDVTLTTDEAANLFYEFTGALTANINVVVPANVRQFFVRNATTGAYSLTVKTLNGTGVKVLQGTRVHLECDGTNVLTPTSEGGAITADASGNVMVNTSTSRGMLTINTPTPTPGLSVTGKFSANVSADIEINRSSTSTSVGQGCALQFNDSGTAANSRLIQGAAGNLQFFGYGAGFWSEHVRIDISGHFGVGVVPATWSGNFRAIELRSASLAENGGGDVYLIANAYYNGSGQWIYKNTDYAAYYGQEAGTHLWYIAPSGTAGNAATMTLAMKVDTSGNLLVGTNSASAHCLYKAVAQGTAIAAVGSTTTVQNSAIFYSVSDQSWNAGASSVGVGKNTSTSRSINASGTINTNGADYAEYMTKAVDCGVLAKGQIVGVDADGKLTDKWGDAVSFMIKSTDPSYVGGDVWGTEEALGMARPVEPVLELPTYTGAPEPGPAPTAPAAQPDNVDDAMQAAYQHALADYELAQQQYAAALAAFEQDRATHAEAVDAARQVFDTITFPAYQVEMAKFEDVMERARQKVDRIAYCGQVPVNVRGAKPGQYVVPVQDGGGIAGALVDDADISFAQYRRAVGRVLNVLPDGRPNVVVKVV